MVFGACGAAASKSCAAHKSWFGEERNGINEMSQDINNIFLLDAKRSALLVYFLFSINTTVMMNDIYVT